MAEWIIDRKGHGEYGEIDDNESLGENGAGKGVVSKEGGSDLGNGAGIWDEGDNAERVKIGKIGIVTEGGIVHVVVVGDAGWDGGVGWF